jgi:CspA family cold shock protein
MKGTVKMFNKEKGFGFIRAEDGSDVFFHYSALVMDGYKTASEGEKVEFDVENSERGLRASNVRKIAPAAAPAATTEPETK